MNKDRLLAFSDGVIAIIITIMVLEMHVPHGAVLADLQPMVPVLLSYIISFIYVAIYWNNHHHMMQAVRRVNGGVLWANNHLLFWLSLVPFATGWMGQNDFATIPVALYGVLLFMAGLAYYILVRQLVAHEGDNPTLASAIGSDFKGKISLVMYAAAVGLAFVQTGISIAVYALVALLWLVPDRRIERELKSS